MNYKMTVIIRDPETEQGMNSEIVMELDVHFSYDPENYGNGHYVSINGDHGFQNLYDLRYSNEFDRNEKIAWLAGWANRYWCGKDGAYELKSITIERM